MILKDHLYTINIRENTPDGPIFRLELNPSHLIYGAHFPGHPITPGVCILQIVKELLEEVVGKSLSIRQVANVKFLSIISPIESKDLSCRFIKVETEEEGKKVKTQAVLFNGKETFAKVSMICNGV